jgi:hypothetical protein
MTMPQRVHLATTTVAAGSILLTLAVQAAAQAPLAAQWHYGLDLQCRGSHQATFDMARTFGLEVYRDDRNGKGLYVTETGVLAGVGGLERGKPRPPAWHHKLDLRVRPAGIQKFRRATTLGVEVYRDDNNRHWMYITETGGFSAAPAARRSSAAKVATNPVWLHGLDLKVRRAGQDSWDRATKTWSIEVYRDVNNGNLVYLCESGLLAVVPQVQESFSSPTPSARAPVWLAGFDLLVPKSSQTRRQGRFTAFGLEVYRDENNGNLIYLAETGSLAVVAGQRDLPVQGGKVRQAVLTHRLDLPYRKANQKDFDARAFGVAAFTDANTACILYVSEKGAVTAVPGRILQGS